MKAALIIIGDEILSGRVDDCNILVCARILKKHGIIFNEIRIISDNIDKTMQTFAELQDTNPIVLSSGGLGPTLDDLTKSSLAQYLGVKINENPLAHQVAKTNYSRKNLEYISSQTLYHHVPTGVIALDNPKGLAPGLLFKKDGKYLACAPGVPSEFEAMLEQVILPYISKDNGEKTSELENISIRTLGIPEEKIFNEIDNKLWDKLSQFGKVSSLPQSGGVDIVISLDSSYDKVNTLPKIQAICDQSDLSKSIWQYGDKSLEEYLIEMMISKKLTLSLAESCTGGLVADKVTNIPGASQVFLAGVNSYSNESKIKILNIKESKISQYGVVSEEIAIEMSKNISCMAGSDYALSLTGLAGPAATNDHPIGTVFIGVKTPSKIFCHKYQTSGDRIKLKERFAQKALFLLFNEINQL